MKEIMLVFEANSAHGFERQKVRDGTILEAGEQQKYCVRIMHEIPTNPYLTKTPGTKKTNDTTTDDDNTGKKLLS